MDIYSLGLDIASLAVIALCAFYYARKGFVAGIFSFFGTLVAAAAAWWTTRQLAPAIFDLLFRSPLESRVTEAIAAEGIEDIYALVRNVLQFIPQGWLEAIGIETDLSVDFAASDVAGRMVEQILAPIVTPLIMIVLFFVLFALLRVLVGVVRSLAAGLAKVPAINTVNGFLGVLVGVLVGGIYVFLGMCVIWAYDSTVPAQPLGDAYFAKSIAFRIFSGLNFFS